MAITDSGAKRLMASILRQAYDDFNNKNACPEWCEFIDGCVNRNMEACKARNFIHSTWCATLCDGLDVDHDKYVEMTMKEAKITKETFKYIEAELRGFHETIIELQRLKNDIITETSIPDTNGGKGYGINDKTYQKTERLLMNKRLKRLENLISAVDKVYRNCDNEKQKMIRMKYWQNKLTDRGIMDALSIEKATFYRWRRGVIYEIAMELGYL